MFNLQGSEIIVILLLALVILGPEKLPGAIRRFTKTYAELRKMGNSFQSEVKEAFDEPMREVRETADLIKQQVDVDALEAERAASAALDESAAAERADLATTASDPDPGAPFADDGPTLLPPVAGTARPGPATPAAPSANGSATGPVPAVPPPPVIPSTPSVPPPPPPFSASPPPPDAAPEPAVVDERETPS